jgi:hypothetical protein
VTACAAPLPLATLVDYWAGELAADEAAQAEEHLFACAACSGALGWVAVLAGAVGPLVRRGRVPLLLTPALFERLGRDGVRLRHHDVDPGGRTACTAGPDDDLLVTWLRGDFRAGERVDLEFLDPGGSFAQRVEDVPVYHEHGSVALAERADVIRAAPIPVYVMRLHGVSPAGERTIGEYTLVHTAWPAG